MSQEEEIEIARLKAELAELKKQLSDEIKRAEFKRLYNEFKKKYPKVFIPDEGDVPTDPEPPGCPDLPNDGRPQPSKGAKTDANTWSVVNMRDDPSLFKIVDDKNINVADQFHTKENAEQYVAHFKCAEPTPQPEPEPTPTPTPTPGQVGPYASTGKELQSTTRGPTTRHYASDKPDDETIEKNVKNIPFKNYQFIVYTTINKIEHDDTISLKFGGTHMGSGWYDTGVSFEDGECCLGTEKKHPSTQLCVIKGPKVGNIVGKKIGIAGVYFDKGDKAHIELWTNLGSGWKKQVEGDNVNNFNPKSDKDEAQERIDGFVKNSVPTLHMAIVQEIA